MFLGSWWVGVWELPCVSGDVVGENIDWTESSGKDGYWAFMTRGGVIEGGELLEVFIFYIQYTF